jgi:hypothetical protein
LYTKRNFASVWVIFQTQADGSETLEFKVEKTNIFVGTKNAVITFWLAEFSKYYLKFFILYTLKLPDVGKTLWNS